MMVERVSLDVSDNELMRISRERQLSLSLEEMKALRAYYRRLGRSATDVELETFAQTWSEHCCHKTFRGDILLEDGRVVSDLLRSTIAKVTEELKPGWCLSVFEDNAGIIDFEGDYALAFKVETHNHPSALEPFGGAATGVGGVIRDILGVWAEPIANTDVLCFGPLDYPVEKLPPGMKHPAFIHRYVVAGIGHYGNNMGIPTVNGAVYFDESYTGNPLVYCGTLGLVRKSRYRREAEPGDALILAGGRTGRDGIHGVTFASIELTQDQERSVVQIGDPIQEEKLARALIAVRDAGLGRAVTDLGGGGLSSAIGEMANHFGLGAVVHLDRVPLKHPGMEPWEIWTSESQERMLLVCREVDVDEALELFSAEDVEATVIGWFTEDAVLRLFHSQQPVGEISISALFKNRPKVRRRAEPKVRELREPEVEAGDLKEDLLMLLAMPNISSKEEVIRSYDHEVKAGTVLKPLQGFAGPGDAAVIKPLFHSYRGAVLSCGMNPEYGKIDAYSMAACAIDEAVRNNVAAGGRRIALLDNFCWGNPERPDRLHSLVKAAQACYDTALQLGTPFISGKDSLYNESELGPVTPTLLISAIGVIPDVRMAVSMDLKEPGNSIYILGETAHELGGSHYYKLKGFLGRTVPKVRAVEARRTFGSLTRAIDAGLVKSCHDLSEGGLAVAASEMAFSGGLGMEIELDRVPTRGELRTDALLFSESQSRFLVEVRESGRFEKLMKGCAVARIGAVTEEELVVFKRGGRAVLEAELRELWRSWRHGS